MKREQLEKANKIDSEIKKLTQLDNILTSAASGQNTLAAINRNCYGEVTVVSDVNIPPIILAKFRQVIADEAIKLDKEFESL
jgi:hypothetical protein